VRCAARQDLYLSKMIFGKVKVKFRMLYQALTTMNPHLGKDNGKDNQGMTVGHLLARR